MCQWKPYATPQLFRSTTNFFWNVSRIVKRINYSPRCNLTKSQPTIKLPANTHCIKIMIYGWTFLFVQKKTDIVSLLNTKNQYRNLVTAIRDTISRRDVHTSITNNWPQQLWGVSCSTIFLCCIELLNCLYLPLCNINQNALKCTKDRCNHQKNYKIKKMWRFGWWPIELTSIDLVIICSRQVSVQSPLHRLLKWSVGKRSRCNLIRARVESIMSSNYFFPLYNHHY